MMDRGASLPASLTAVGLSAKLCCVAVGVARALQLRSLPAVVATLLGFVAYDAIGTLTAAGALETAAGAVDTATGALDAAAPAPAPSVMAGVAQARLASGGGAPLWQPGLLTTWINGRVTDGLGLSDILVPGILAGWALVTNY